MRKASLMRSQVARPVIGGRSAPRADGEGHRPGLGPDLSVALVAGALAQVVQVRH